MTHVSVKSIITLKRMVSKQHKEEQLLKTSYLFNVYSQTPDFYVPLA